jgi:hypothetical protein
VKTRLLLPLALFAAACSSDDATVSVLVPQEVEFPWDAAYDAVNDGRVALLPLDVMVYDSLTGDALVGADVTVTSDAATFVPADAVVAADPGCVDCAWDAFRNEYVELDVDGTDPWLATTDEDGLVRVFALVDSLSDMTDGAVTVSVTASAAHGVQVQATPVPGQTVRLVPR